MTGKLESFMQFRAFQHGQPLSSSHPPESPRTYCPLQPTYIQSSARIYCEHPTRSLVDDVLKPTSPSTLWSSYSRPSTTNVLIVERARLRLHKRVKPCCVQLANLPLVTTGDSEYVRKYHLSTRLSLLSGSTTLNPGRRLICKQITSALMLKRTA